MGLTIKYPSKWGQGDCVPLWEFEGNALKKPKSAGRCPAPAKGQCPFEPLQNGVNNKISLKMGSRG
jgi:hypothetical protein